ncbi:TPA: tyrosine-type recombinase/integrase [Vibrio parahaemolyticus]|uniref:tyrosine-type recombinase/integrase n=1 Tax=Vibrio TaxID=662 RepID=UPI000415BE9F|nr:site-specific integrase [Vibrio parahaemolyticus]EHU4977824.1 tyrosine-type recombinase/integrase [Vibrio vulnificus]MCG9556023.1 site-specific integrase [Vibrio kanaloae]KWU37417.1 integrase [Vibrio parahaemolyticus]MDF4968442.1 site-specific integrase [Vibrio parahaemolyticus]ODN32342.1 integrase [Vibrio parahaemolyticus]
MGKLKVNQVKSLVSNNKVGRHSDGDGLYLMIPKSGQAYWMLRYTIMGKRREMTIDKVAHLSLADARYKAMELKKKVSNEEDPLVERKQHQAITIKLVEQLYEDWYTDLATRLKHPNIPKRVYERDIGPIIGRKKIKSVTPLDIRTIIRNVANSGRPTVANDTLMYCKQLFNHGIKLGLNDNNPASAFSVNDAGGVEGSRDRKLTLDEIKKTFDVFQQNLPSFGRENYLACALLLSLGVRKTELTEAKWSEFDLKNALWHLPGERVKKGDGITIPLTEQVLAWLEELHTRACGSEYLFPARRTSKQPHMGKDTLNRAISKLFGREPGRKVQPPNKMGEMEMFTVHDLRRTFRTLLSKCGVAPHIAERCLNHKLGKLNDTYDIHDYLDERKEALGKLSKLLDSYIK